jgi:pullulanase/glycogen debranching enzyme
MLLSGDELGRTQLGNNNAYSQDNEVSWLDWGPVAGDAALLPFVRSLISLRAAHPLLRHGSASVVGTAPLTVLISPDGPQEGPDAALLLALNPADAPAVVPLPADQPRRWVRYLDSADAVPLAENGAPLPDADATLELGGRSVALLGIPLAPEG